MSTPNVIQNVWICRHGNRIDFIDKSWEGDDPFLSPDGIVPAQETGARLVGEGIQHIFASPFLRTVETAHHIATALGLTVKVEPGASEWMNEKWFPNRPVHIPVPDLVDRFGNVDPDYTPAVLPQHPETAEEAYARSGKAARTVADAFEGDILLVGHGHSVDGMARGLMGKECEIHSGLCTLIKIARQNGTTTLELNGDSSHLTSGEQHSDRLI